MMHHHPGVFTFENEIPLPEIHLKAFLETLRGNTVYYCPNPGNAGDSAIALATYQLFAQVGLNFQVVGWNDAFDATGRVVVYGGGGNLGSSEYAEARTFIKRHYPRAERLVILPHTIRGNEDILKKLGESVDIFCREQVSYDWVKKQVVGANVFLADDMALHLDLETILDQWAPSVFELVGRIGHGVGNSALRRVGLGLSGYEFKVNGRLGASALHQLVRRFTLQANELKAMRTDVEGTNREIPPGNVDVSRVFEYGVAPRSNALQATTSTLSYLDQFKHIVTNRLHIGILGGLLNKEVDFYPNNYFKNKAVFEFSMRDRFPNVRWRAN